MEIYFFSNDKRISYTTESRECTWDSSNCTSKHRDMKHIMHNWQARRKNLLQGHLSYLAQNIKKTNESRAKFALLLESHHNLHGWNLNPWSPSINTKDWTIWSAWLLCLLLTTNSLPKTIWICSMASLRNFVSKESILT